MNKKVRRIRRAAKAKAIQARDLLKPRLIVFKSTTHIYSQIVIRDSLGDRVLASASTIDSELKPNLSGTKTNQATQVGKLLGKRAKEKNVVDICFDRRGYKYHGCVKALADGAREAGLNF